jgi:two-component system invasion response regulator UvrY
MSEGLELVREADWDLVVTGLSFGGGGGGLELLKQFMACRPQLRVVVLSTHARALYARRSFNAGAAGYVIKDSSRAEVVHAIQHVMSGSRYMSPRLATSRAADLKPGCGETAHRLLSDREFEVMRLLAAGHTVAAIAGRMSVSGQTIRTYRARLLRKLATKGNGVSSCRCSAPAAGRRQKS